MNQPWSDLLNAHHIDWVLRSLKKDPALWEEAWAAAWAAAGAAARDAAWDAVSGAAKDAARVSARDAARTAVAALVAYDDCDEYLKMPYEELRIWAALSENPAAIFLRPMTYVRDKMHESALV